MDALDTLKAAGHSDSILDTVVDGIFEKWKQRASGGEDITLLQLSVKGAKTYTYTDIHSEKQPS